MWVRELANYTFPPLSPSLKYHFNSEDWSFSGQPGGFKTLKCRADTMRGAWCCILLVSLTIFSSVISASADSELTLNNNALTSSDLRPPGHNLIVNFTSHIIILIVLITSRGRLVIFYNLESSLDLILRPQSIISPVMVFPAWFGLRYQLGDICYGNHETSEKEFNVQFT